MALVYLGIHAGAIAALWVEWSVESILLFFILLHGRGFCISAGYHRLLAHKAYRTSRLFRFLLAAGGCASLRGGPLWWVALHRYHHGHSDTEADTFTPEKGFWWSYAGWLVSGRYDTTDYRKVADLARIPELRWLNRYWIVPPALLATVVLLVGGWSMFLIGFCVSSVVLFHGMAALDSLNHLVGFQRYETGDNSRNSVVLALLNLGEGWHNNHHHYPSSASAGFFWWEMDATYSLLRLLALFRIVWGLRQVPATVLRSNLKARNRTLPTPVLIAPVRTPEPASHQTG
jgi:stearoyl-CoA desaturase (delta-9 desaturase)